MTRDQMITKPYIYIYIYNIDFSNSPTKLLGQLMKLPKISTEKKKRVIGLGKSYLKKGRKISE